MKKLLLISAIVLIAACAARETKVMARYVPERMDDFVFENDLICGRIYGKALEGDPTSPGIDIWVKTPGPLVADRRYKDDIENGISYHIDHGNGKDCYKVAVSLGGGASSPVIDDTLRFPATNWRSWEILEQGPEKVVFVLHYPQWDCCGCSIALDKKITVTAGSHFCRVDDSYTFSGRDSLTVAAGIFRHPEQNTVERELSANDRYAVWEHASDQSAEPEEGMIGVAVFVPGAESAGVIDEGRHGICERTIAPGETFTYWFGSCWSKGDVTTADKWFSEVELLK